VHVLYLSIVREKIMDVIFQRLLVDICCDYDPSFD